MENKRVFSALKPTGDLTIGNYIGALKNMVEMSNTYDCYYAVADLHSLTVDCVPADLRRRSYDFMAFFMAIGLDPEKSTLFIQSHVPAHAELGWILNCYTQFGEAKRMTQFKDKSEKAPQNVNVGLFAYPTLMAADILAYDSDIVPVGKDQVQHVEIARDIAGAINAHYNCTLLKQPEYHIEENVAVVPGIDGRKMSKSYGNVIPLFADDKEIKKAIFSIKTDSRPMEEPKNPDEILVYEIYKSIATPEQLQEMGDGLRQGKLGYGHIKNMLLDAVIREVQDAREKYSYYMNHYDEVENMLAEGAEKARPAAQKILTRLKNAVFGR